MCDKKECVICQNTNSTSRTLFEVEFKDSRKEIYCVICLSEYPMSKNPEQISKIINIGEYD